MNRCSRSGRSRESTVYRKPNALGLPQTVARHRKNGSRSDSLTPNSTRSCAYVSRSRCIVATRYCASWPTSYVVVPLLVPDAVFPAGPGIKIANHRHCWLLRARRERPAGRRASDKRG
jgi:hypothetical protein